MPRATFAQGQASVRWNLFSSWVIEMRALCITYQPLTMDMVDHPICRRTVSTPQGKSEIHRSASGTDKLLGALAIALLLMVFSPPILGQAGSPTASISLVARLESLSVAATFANDAGWDGPDMLHHVLVTTSWAVPSNRTTVSVTENGTRLFSQALGESGRPGRRMDPLPLPPSQDKSEEANAENQPRSVIILVQAL